MRPYAWRPVVIWLPCHLHVPFCGVPASGQEKHDRADLHAGFGVGCIGRRNSIIAWLWSVARLSGEATGQCRTPSVSSVNGVAGLRVSSRAWWSCLFIFHLAHAACSELQFRVAGSQLHVSGLRFTKEI